jgi:hypothetical protein
MRNETLLNRRQLAVLLKLGNSTFNFHVVRMNLQPAAYENGRPLYSQHDLPKIKKYFDDLRAGHRWQGQRHPSHLATAADLATHLGLNISTLAGAIRRGDMPRPAEEFGLRKYFKKADFPALAAQWENRPRRKRGRPKNHN